jgi:hypothetical protein
MLSRKKAAGLNASQKQGNADVGTKAGAIAGRVHEYFLRPKLPRANAVVNYLRTYMITFLESSSTDRASHRNQGLSITFMLV